MRRTHAIAKITLLRARSTAISFRSISTIHSTTETWNLITRTASTRPDPRGVRDVIWLTGTNNRPLDILATSSVVLVELKDFGLFLVEVGAGVGGFVFEHFDEAVEAYGEDRAEGGSDPVDPVFAWETGEGDCWTEGAGWVKGAWE